MSDRRGIYFAFQGLFMAVLLLLFLYQYRGIEGWAPRFFFLVSILGSSLALIRFLSRETLALGWVQSGLFLGDAVLASITLYWTQPQSEMYLIYFFIIFGTALTRNFRQCIVVASVSSLLYLISGWRPDRGFPGDTDFWLRVNLLWVTSSLMAILSRDSQQIQSDQERKYQDRLIQVERLATLGQIAGEVAHSIKAPLTTIRVNAEVLSHRLGKPKSSLQELDQILEEVDRCKEILKNLLDLGRIEEMDQSPIDLREPIRSALDAIGPQIRKHHIWLEVNGLDSSLTALGDQSLLHEAIVAVLQNAIDAVCWPFSDHTVPAGKKTAGAVCWPFSDPCRLAGGKDQKKEVHLASGHTVFAGKKTAEAARSSGTIRLTLKSKQVARWWKFSSRSTLCELTIEDNGKGLAPEDTERIFKPFFTTKGREGSGLGLSSALRIFQKHGGSIEAFSDGLGCGSRFVLTIPEATSRRRSGRVGRSA